jgi:hypothetical protein
LLARAAPERHREIALPVLPRENTAGDVHSEALCIVFTRVEDHACGGRMSFRPRRRNANTHASALPGKTSALATTARPATALGGANLGSVDAPGMYGGMRPRFRKNQPAAYTGTKAASAAQVTMRRLRFVIR